MGTWLYASYLMHKKRKTQGGFNFDTQRRRSSRKAPKGHEITMYKQRSKATPWGSLTLIRHFHFPVRWIPFPMADERKAEDQTSIFPPPFPASYPLFSLIIPPKPKQKKTNTHCFYWRWGFKRNAWLKVVQNKIQWNPGKPKQTAKKKKAQRGRKMEDDE